MNISKSPHVIDQKQWPNYKSNNPIEILELENNKQQKFDQEEGLIFNFEKIKHNKKVIQPQVLKQVPVENLNNENAQIKNIKITCYNILSKIHDTNIQKINKFRQNINAIQIIQSDQEEHQQVVQIQNDQNDKQFKENIKDLSIDKVNSKIQQQPQEILTEQKTLQLTEIQIAKNSRKFNNLNQVQKHRYQLMEKLKKIDKQLQQLKKKQISRNSSLNYNPIRTQISKQQEDIVKHENAINFIKKMNEDKRNKYQKKIKELEQIKIDKKIKIQNLLQIKNKEKQQRNKKIMKLKYNQLAKRSVTVVDNNVEQRLGSVFENQKIKRNTKKQKEDRLKQIEVQFNPTKINFPKSKMHKILLEQQRQAKKKQQEQKSKKMEKFMKRKEYNFFEKKSIMNDYTQQVYQQPKQKRLKNLVNKNINGKTKISLNQIAINRIREQQQQNQEDNEFHQLITNQ